MLQFSPLDEVNTPVTVMFLEYRGNFFLSFFYPIDPSARFGGKKCNFPTCSALCHRNYLPSIPLWDFQNVI